MSAAISAVLRELAAELAAPVGAGYTVSPDGRRAAVLEWPAHPSRPRAPIRLVHYGSWTYDTTRRCVSGTEPRSGTLLICDITSGERLPHPPLTAAGPPVWSLDGRSLAGLSDDGDGAGYRVWVLDADTAGLRYLDPLRAGCSMLGLVRGPALWWTKSGDLLIARDAIDRTFIDPCDDLAAEPEHLAHGEPAYHHDLLAIATAARVDLVRTDPVTGRVKATIASGCVLADCRVDASGGAALIGIARDREATARLLSERVIGYERHDLIGEGGPELLGSRPIEPVRSDGGVLHEDLGGTLEVRYGPEGPALIRCVSGREIVVHQVMGPGPRVAGPGPPSRRTTPDAAHHVRLPPAPGPKPAALVELWPLPPDGLPHRRSLLAAPTIPPLHRAHLATGTAIVRLYIRLPAGERVRFTEIRDRLVDAVTALRQDLAAENDIDTDRLALSGHSFGAACSAVVLAHAGDTFRCAILRAGAYNRTPTPRGFQDEHRSLWQARDVYDGFTLAYDAPAITCPVLILQGSADATGVTDALQAWTFYDTLLAAQGHARLVLLYNEGHTFNTREGLLTTAREELHWMNRWA